MNKKKKKEIVSNPIDINTVKSKINNNLVYSNNNLHLICGDSQHIIKLIPDNSVDLIFTDPPFGINYKDYDASNEIFFALENEYYRILKDTGWFVFWWSIKSIPEISKFKKFIYKWMIIAQFPSTFARSAFGSRCYTPIFIFSKTEEPGPIKPLYDIFVAAEHPEIHFTKIKSGDFKPTYTQSLILNMFISDKEGSVILDPFAGYGSLLLSAKLFGFKGTVIGIEKDIVRYEVAKKILTDGLNGPIPDLENEIKLKLQKEGRG